MKKIVWQKARRISQLFFAGLFVYLLFASVEQREAPALADIFFRLDPLTAISEWLSAKAWEPRAGLAILTILLTVFFGRIWCGWICPMGTLLEWTPLRSAREWSKRIHPGWRGVKYGLLFIILGAALLENLSLLVLDPLALLTRFSTTAFIPGLNLAITSIERLIVRVEVFRPAIEALEKFWRGTLLPTLQPSFDQGFWIALIFMGIIGLNALADRFWCRYLCPLGGLLGLLSRFSIFRLIITKGCTRCRMCSSACKLDAIEQAEDGFKIMSSECTMCLDCINRCPHDLIGLRFALQPARPQPFDPGRRKVLQSAAIGAVGALMLRTDTRNRETHAWLLRPPGAQDENVFLSKCLRCSECMKICPTSALQPSLTQAGLEGLWTPVMKPRVGYCDFGCHACGQICPSQAIPLLSLEEKRTQVIGKASVDRNRCLPWASNTPCIVCEEMCPLPEKAIYLDEISIKGAEGEDLVLQRPYVNRDLCIGCGICEHHCPLESTAAIRVYNRSLPMK
ncbi:MAG TPA: 4Fe-4S binding protein [Anaerolineaceae bacterium]|nr:4Fe-4S binding protein [Anaerolineaceae bacterium]HPN50900.1 4Fe-4S binding protein [Anaerolineaceae bacterium]